MDFMPRMLTRQEFDAWLSSMDEALQHLFDVVPDEVRQQLDYSVSSVDLLEQWFLSNYSNLKEAHNPEGIAVIDAAGRYVGETFRKHLGGEWGIELDDDKDIGYGYAGIENFGTDGIGLTIVHPWTWVTTAIARRTGHFIRDRFESHLKRVRR